MSKPIWIQIRVEEDVKAAIKEAAKRRGRDMGPWLLYLAAQADADVAKAMGVDPKAGA